MTPAVVAAKKAGIPFELHEYEGIDPADGDYAVAVANALGIEPERLFKTLVVSVDGKLEVFVVPADRQLDLRCFVAFDAPTHSATRSLTFIAMATR